MKYQTRLLTVIIALCLANCGGSGGGSAGSGGNSAGNANQNISSSEPEVMADVTVSAPANDTQSENANITDTDSDSQVTVSSASIQASPSFNFSVDKAIEIQFSSLPATDGVLNLYSGSDFYDSELDIHYPDYQTLLASWRLSEQGQYQVMFNQNWQYLILEWVPESAVASEQYFYFPASQLNNLLTLTL